MSVLPKRNYIIWPTKLPTPKKWKTKNIENQLSYSATLTTKAQRDPQHYLTYISKWSSIICRYSQHMWHYLIQRSGKFLITRTSILVQPTCKQVRHQEYSKPNGYQKAKLSLVKIVILVLSTQQKNNIYFNLGLKHGCFNVESDAWTHIDHFLLSCYRIIIEN